MDGQVALRPVGEDDLAMLEELTQDSEQVGEFGWFGWFDRRRWRRGWDENCLLGADGGTLIVVSGGDRLGLVNWRKHQTTPAGYCWEIGIALLPEWRGQGIGWRAQAMFCSYLFGHTPVQRIEAATHAENAAEQRSLEKAGFTLEGVVRAAEFRAGQWRDGYLYSRLRTDPDPLADEARKTR